MSTFKTNPWSVGELLPLMDRCRIVLPEFQRSFVWWPGDIDQLLTSLVLDFPAGSLLFLKANGEADLAWRPAEGVDPAQAHSPDYLVLDGQQRLTSLSLALNARGDHLFFMDLERLEDDDVENGLYPLRRKVAERKHLLEREIQFERHTYPVWAAVGKHADNWWFQDYVTFHSDRGGDRDALRARAHTLEERYVRPLRDYSFPVVELPAETSLEAVCQIFETLNKTGMKLTVFDLLTAKFWPKGVNLRALLEAAREEYPLLGSEEFDVDATFLLQAIALRRSGLCKRSDLLKLSHEHFESEWALVCRGASAALAVLKAECGVLTKSWLPYGALFPSLFAIASEALQLTGPETGAAWEKVRRWFWCSCFGGRYEGPANTLNATDFRQVMAWVADYEAVPEAVAEFALEAVDLRRAERQRSALYRAVICLTVVNGARDFHTGHRLSTDALRDPGRRIEDHHLLPTGWLKAQNPPRPPQNSVLNRALIDHETNRRIGAQAPSVYLASIAAALGEERVEGLLGSHLIPSEGPGALDEDNPEAFLSARERLLIGAIAGVTGARLPEGAGSEVYLDPKRPFTNELALRRVLRELSGRALWYEQHMSAKVLELLIEEVQPEHLTELRLLSGPANLNAKTKGRFERFQKELTERGLPVDWRVLSADLARDIHARVIFDDSSAWELPPLNSLLKGTVDSIRPSQIPRSLFDDAWHGSEARSLPDVVVE